MDASRREPLRVALELFEALLREAELVGAVVDREVRAIAEPLRLAAQDAAAGRVEGHHPRCAGRRPDEMLDALAHLGGGLVREGDREDLGRLRADGGEQVRDAPREDARLARAGAGDDEHRPLRRQHRLPLRLVQVGEIRLRLGDGHRSIVAGGLGGASVAVAATETEPSRLAQLPCTWAREGVAKSRRFRHETACGRVCNTVRGRVGARCRYRF